MQINPTGSRYAVFKTEIIYVLGKFKSPCKPSKLLDIGATSPDDTNCTLIDVTTLLHFLAWLLQDINFPFQRDLPTKMKDTVSRMCWDVNRNIFLKWAVIATLLMFSLHCCMRVAVTMNARDCFCCVWERRLCRTGPAVGVDALKPSKPKNCFKNP
jgi:hypothetical protein